MRSRVRRRALEVERPLLRQRELQRGPRRGDGLVALRVLGARRQRARSRTASASTRARRWPRTGSANASACRDHPPPPLGPQHGAVLGERGLPDRRRAPPRGRCAPRPGAPRSGGAARPGRPAARTGSGATSAPGPRPGSGGARSGCRRSASRRPARRSRDGTAPSASLSRGTSAPSTRTRLRLPARSKPMPTSRATVRASPGSSTSADTWKPFAPKRTRSASRAPRTERSSCR